MTTPTPHTPMTRDKTPTPRQHVASHALRDGLSQAGLSRTLTPKSGRQPQVPHSPAGDDRRDCVDRALADGRPGTTTIHVGRVKPSAAPEAQRAHRALRACVAGRDSAVMAATLQRLRPSAATCGLRYDNYALISQAAETRGAFACLYLAMQSLPSDDVDTVMRLHGAKVCYAAQEAGSIDYANWLVYSFGDGQTQFISER